jgi:N utilization substance protein A
MNADLLRIVDAISRDKNIDKDLVFQDLELAMASAATKTFGPTEDCQVTIDRLSGEIRAIHNGQPVEMKDLGRIAAQTAKQIMMQRIREAERGSIYEEFSERVGTILTGTAVRYEGGALIVGLGRTEGFLPRSEQIPGESSHHPGERVRAMILDVRETPHHVKIVLTRSHPDFIKRLFELEVPEVAEKIIEIKALAREAGYRTKVAVTSIDTKVDAVGACVGVRGSRIRNIVDELGGEKIDIVRWNESSQILISNALKPAEVQEIALCFELGRATVVVAEDQLSLAIGKRGQNVRLAAQLTGWDIDILTPAEYNKGLDDLERVLKSLEGVDDVTIEKIMALGIISVADIEEVGHDPLITELEMEEALAEMIVTRCSEEAKVIAELAAQEAERAKAEKALAETQAKDNSESEPESGKEAAPEETPASTSDPESLSPDGETTGDNEAEGSPEPDVEQVAVATADDAVATEGEEAAAPDADESEQTGN